MKGRARFVPDLSFMSSVRTFTWDGGSFDTRMIRNGAIHITEAAAIAHADALLSFTRSDK